jgi:Ca2+-binding RTX toxin-like protein
MWDRAYGGKGNDLIHGGDGKDYLYGEIGNDRLFGDGGDDFIFGQDGADYIRGNAGNDYINGGLGKDTIYADGGQDRIEIQSGNDIVDGGRGNDTFIIYADTPRITDESGGEDYDITNPDASPVINDRAGSDELIFSDELIGELKFERFANDLLVRVDGYRGETTIVNFFLGRNYRIEKVTVDDGDGGTDKYDLTDLKHLSNGEVVDGSDFWG